jgi:hypothetical protein
VAVRDLKLPAGLYGAVASCGVGRLARVHLFPVEMAGIARLLAGHPRASRVAGGERLR